MIRKFEDLDVWKESMRLTTEIYTSLKCINDYVLKQQIQRTLISVPSNIAEGFDRQSNKEFIQYLYISKGFCSELKTQLYLLGELEYLEKKLLNTYIERSRKVSAMLYSLIKTRKEKF